MIGERGMLFGMFHFHTRETPPSSEELARAFPVTAAPTASITT